MQHGRKKKEAKQQLSEEELKKQKEQLDQIQTLHTQVLSLSREPSVLTTPESLKLTAEVIEQSSDLYTTFNIRKQQLQLLMQSMSQEEIKKLLEDELFLNTKCMKADAKCYTLWFHRQWLLINFQQNYLVNSLQQEIKLCEYMLAKDERNFHCWNYRIWLSQQAISQNLLTLNKELEFTMQMINRNFSNYSAWHFRSHLMNQIYGGNGQFLYKEKQQIISELELTLNAFYTLPKDQSA